MAQPKKSWEDVYRSQLSTAPSDISKLLDIESSFSDPIINKIREDISKRKFREEDLTTLEGQVQQLTKTRQQARNRRNKLQLKGEDISLDVRPSALKDLESRFPDYDPSEHGKTSFPTGSSAGHVTNKPDLEKLPKLYGKGLDAVGNVLDATGRVGRYALTGETDYEKFQAKMKEPGWRSDLRNVAKGVATGPAAFMTTARKGGESLIDLAHGVPLEHVSSDWIKNYGKELAKDREASTDFLLGMTADPGLGLGVGGTAQPLKQALKQADKLAKVAKLEAPAAQRLAKQLPKIYEKTGGTARLKPSVDALLKKTGVAPETAKKVIGPAHEFLGERGVHFLGKEVIPKAKIPGAAIATKAGRNIAGLLGGVPNVPDELGGKHARMGIKQHLTDQRNLVQSNIQEELGGLAKELETVGSHIPKRRREELVRRALDPEYLYTQMSPEMTSEIRPWLEPGAPHLQFKHLAPEEVTLPTGQKIGRGRAVPVNRAQQFEKYGPDLGTAVDKSRTPPPRFTSLEEVESMPGDPIPFEATQVQRPSPPTDDIPFMETKLSKTNITPTANKPDLAPQPMPTTPGEWYSITPRDPLLQMNQGEEKFAQVLSQHFGKQLKRMKDAGVPVGEAQNYLTGKYVPRIEKPKTFKEKFFERPQFPQRGPGYDATKHRGDFGGLGTELKQGEAPGEAIRPKRNLMEDPLEIAPKYQRSVEKNISEAKTDKFITDHFATKPGPNTVKIGDKHVPEEIAKIVRQAQDAGFEHFNKNIITAFMDSAMNLYRENRLFGAPRSVVKNITGDSLNMAIAGMADTQNIGLVTKVRGKGAPDEVIFRSPSGTEWTRERLKNLYRRMGAQSPEVTSMGRFMGPADLEKGMRKGAGQKFPGIRSAPLKTAGRALKTAGNPTGRPLIKATEAWDGFSKAIAVTDGLRKGMPENVAIKRAFDVLPDYGDQDMALRWMKRFMAFPTYQYKMVPQIAKNIVRKPAAMGMIARAPDMFGTQEGPVDAPGRAQAETRRSIPLGPQAIQAANQAVGEFIPPGFGAQLNMNDPIFETLAPVSEMMSGNLEPFGGQLRPEFKMAVEGMAAKDLFSKKDMTPTSKPFAKGNVLAPKIEQALGKDPGAMQAGEGESAWFDRYVAPYLIGDLPMWALNQMMLEQGASGPVLGSHYEGGSQEENRQKRRLLNLMTGQQIMPTDPTTQFRDLMYDPATKRTLDSTDKTLYRLKKAYNQ